MSENNKKISEFSARSLRKIAREVILKRTALIIHFWIYVFVNLILVIINYLTLGFNLPTNMWFLHSITGWGIGLVLHTSNYFIFKKGVINAASVGMIYHSINFIIVNLYLTYIDMFWDATYFWAGWVFLIWIFIFTSHLVFYFYIVPKREDAGTDRPWIERKFDEEIEKALNKGV